MAVLVKRASDGERRVHLYAEHVVGRSPTCRLVSRHRSVSSLHACLSWRGNGWMVRDLGSRNGTYVNGQRVRKRPLKLRANDEIVFGDQGETWVFIDDSAPRALLIPIRDAADAAGVGEIDAPTIELGHLRAFPSDEDPQVTIFQDADGHLFLERADDDIEELDESEDVVIGDARYRLHLPGLVEGTLSTQTLADAVVESSVRTMRLTLRVAPDEETASAIIEAGTVQATLRPRVHLYLLVHLARLRVDDAATGPNEGDAGEEGDVDENGGGWVAVEVLCDELQLTREQLGLQVFRIRDDMKKIGLADAGEIVDRRRRGWIRVGVPAEQIRLERM